MRDAKLHRLSRADRVPPVKRTDCRCRPIAASGQSLGFSDTCQLMVSTTTAMVKFLVVFLIQNSPNRQKGPFAIK
jgi:hypothetical protein